MDPTKCAMGRQARASVRRTLLVEHAFRASVTTTQTDVSGQENVLDASLTQQDSLVSIVSMDTMEMHSTSSVIVSRKYIERGISKEAVLCCAASVGE